MLGIGRQGRGNLLLLAAALLAAVLLAEASLRLAKISYPTFGRADPVTGTSLLPGAEGWYRREGRAWVRINGDGLRDREHARQKPAGTFRIAVLGDSYAEARQVALEDSFPRILERALGEHAAADDPDFEVINFGTTGYGTARSLLTLRHKVWPYEPDLVLLAFTTGNDLRDNTHGLAKRDHVPYFELDAGGELVLDESFRDHPAWKRRHRLDRLGVPRLVNASALLQLVKQAVAGRPGRGARTAPERPWEEPGSDLEIYRPPAEAAWREAWAITEALLTTMHREVTARGAAFLLVTLSNSVQVHPDPAVRRAFRAALGVADEFYPERRLEGFCRAQGIALATLAPRLREIAEREGTFLHGFANTALGVGHWNQAGHRAGGALIADAVRALRAGAAAQGSAVASDAGGGAMPPPR